MKRVITLSLLLFAACRYLHNQLPKVKIKHYFEEANQCADAHAKFVAMNMEDFSVLDSPFKEISMLLYFDDIGMYHVSRSNS